MSKYTDIDNGSDNPLNLMNINSAYFDMEQLCSFLNSDMKDSTFDYTSLHLNIQSLQAKCIQGWCGNIYKYKI